VGNKRQQREQPCRNSQIPSHHTTALNMLENFLASSEKPSPAASGLLPVTPGLV
jgi:hypothetical protein